MGVTVGVNNLSVVHKDSGGITSAFPDVCKTPAPPAPPVPIPYPNIAKSSDTANGSSTVLCDGNPTCVKDSNFQVSTGDEAGSLFGVASNKVKGKAELFDVSRDPYEKADLAEKESERVKRLTVLLDGWWQGRE